MKFLYTIFIVTVTISFTVSLPIANAKIGQHIPEPHSKEATNTNAQLLGKVEELQNQVHELEEHIKSNNQQPGRGSSEKVEESGGEGHRIQENAEAIVDGAEKADEYDNLGKSHQGLNLRELLLLKAIMDEDMDKNPELPLLQSPQEDEDTSCQYMVCPTVYQPVCGSNTKTYSNYCTLLQETCTDTTLMKLYDGECETEGDEYDENMFDPVFGKLRDFLDDLTVPDLKRAISKLKARRLEILSENEELLTTSKPSAENPQDQTLRKDDTGPCHEKFQATKEQVEISIAKGNPLLDANLPYCDEDGFYSLKQCSGSVCYCVDRLGKPTFGQAPLWQADELTCNQQQHGNVDEAMETLRNLLGQTNQHPR